MSTPTPFKRNPPRKLTPVQASRMITELGHGMSVQEAAVKYNISVSSVYRYKRRDDPPKRLNKPCGTNAAYWRHIRNKERACLRCRIAHAADVQDWKLRDKARKQEALSHGQTP